VISEKLSPRQAYRIVDDIITRLNGYNFARPITIHKCRVLRIILVVQAEQLIRSACLCVSVCPSNNF